jgi:hypothetical protein
MKSKQTQTEPTKQIATKQPSVPQQTSHAAAVAAAPP